MRDALLRILRCPYCGTVLSPVDNTALVRNGAVMEQGVLGCECCAYPVVAGIPVLMANDATRAAMHTLEAGRVSEARAMLLGLDGDRRAQFDAVEVSSHPATYRKTLGILSRDAEADYLTYRPSDPTFLITEAVLRAIGQTRWTVEGRTLDVCGGAGHLTRVLRDLRAPSESGIDPDTVLIDLSFWKLWLATRFVASGVAAVCCDANQPLPFVRRSFSTVMLSDAFPYIWHKRLLADELMRLAGPEGVVFMPHLHSALGDNFSAGDTLTPAAYRDLFAPHHAVLFSETTLFEDYLDHRRVDLTRAVSPHQLGNEPSLTLVASPRTDVFRSYEVPDELGVTGALRVNPLYKVELRGESSVLTLTFPTPEYAEEFADCRRYLPASVTIGADVTDVVSRSDVGADYAELRGHRVLLDLPSRY